MELVDLPIHKYVVELNGRQIATSSDLNIIKKYYVQKRAKLEAKHNEHQYPQSEILKLIDLDVNAILDQVTFI